MSKPASEVFELRSGTAPRRKKVLPWIRFWIGAFMSFGDASVTSPSSDQVLIVRRADDATVSTYTEGFEPPAVHDAIAKDLAAMTAEEFEAEWVH